MTTHSKPNVALIHGKYKFSDQTDESVNTYAPGCAMSHKNIRKRPRTSEVFCSNVGQLFLFSV